MKMNNTLTAFCLSIVLILVNTRSLASEHDIEHIKIAAPISAPFIFEDQQGRPQGFLVDLLALVEKKLALKTDIVIMPWPRAMHEVSAGNIDALMPTLYSDDRALLLVYPKLPIIEFNTVLLKRTQDNIIVDDITQLGTDKIIVKVRSMSMGKVFDAAEQSGLINVVEVRDFDHAIKMLALSRADLVACVDHISNSSLDRLNLRDKITSLSFSDGKVPAYIAFSKAFAQQHNVDELMKKINEVKTTPEYQALVNKYLK